MFVIILVVLSFVAGIVLVYFVDETRRRRTNSLQIELESLRDDLEKQRQSQLDFEAELKRKSTVIDNEIAKHLKTHKEFQARVIQYDELVKENEILKKDCLNLHLLQSRQNVALNETKDKQVRLDAKADELGRLHLKEMLKQIDRSLNSTNYASCKERLQKTIDRVREIGVKIPDTEKEGYYQELKTEYEKVVRIELEREEQARIRTKIREDALREKEIAQKLEQAERERIAVEEALALAMKNATDQHSQEIEKLQKQLQEAIANAERTKSQAELTKAGNVYVISNIGSFGENIFKIGMTRRLEPQDRVDELGDASVPFPFDVHMMIATNNAPQLENILHRKFHRFRINKCNPRKEFFRIDLDSIVKVVEENHGQVIYKADAEALQFRQSLTMNDDDLEFVDATYEDVLEKSKILDEFVEN